MMLEYWIWLASLPVRESLALLERFPSPEDIYCAQPREPEALNRAREIAEDCRRLGLKILTFQDEGYPDRLRHIPDPPMVLYYKGTLPDFNGNAAIGIVGTRKASAYGLQCARNMGYQIGKSGAMVVSGMAFGIDAMAMSGALTAGQTVVGVLGCGADMVYPKSNQKLFREVEEYGCILSEFPPGTRPFGYNFPRRNRIISGLSNGVLVVEAPEGSGALITARRALDQGRDVYVVPGNIDQPGFVGSNQLLKEGASLAVSGWDVLWEYESQYPDKLHREDGLPAALPEEKPALKVAQSAQIPECPTVLKEKLEKKPIDKNPSSAYSDVNAIAKNLSGQEKAIVLALDQGPRLIEDLIAELQIPAGKLLPSLTMLEIKGILRRLPGKRISLK